MHARRAPLRPLPETFAATRDALHRVAETIVAPARVAATGNEIALEAASGGFGTPPFPDGGRVRVEGAELVVEAPDGAARRAALTTLPEAAALAGLPQDGLDPAPLAVDPEAARALGGAVRVRVGRPRRPARGGARRRGSLAGPPVAGAFRRRVRAGAGGGGAARRVRRLTRGRRASRALPLRRPVDAAAGVARVERHGVRRRAARLRRAPGRPGRAGRGARLPARPARRAARRLRPG